MLLVVAFVGEYVDAPWLGATLFATIALALLVAVIIWALKKSEKEVK